MLIKDLVPKQGFDSITVDVLKKGEVREFQKFGKPGRVCTVGIKDESGQCNLSLWNDEIDTVNEGDKLKITDGYTNEWQGQVQVSAGRNGKIEIIGKADTASTAEEPPAAEEKTAEPEETVEPKSKVEEEFIE